MTLKCALGLMSGTSMDGIDIAAVISDGEQIVRRGPSGFVPYEADFRQRIEAALTDAKEIKARADRPGDLGELEREITCRHVSAVRSFLKEHPHLTPDIVGFHGQTVLHRPDEGYTVQLGDGAALATATGIPVVYDMRANDMAHGGQGAPLVPAYHAALARSLPSETSDFPVCFVNIGGISNVTYVPREGDPVAFDSGPGNTLIDQWVFAQGEVPYDADGMIAREGEVIGEIVGRYLGSAFFERPAPKSLDRNDFTLDHTAGLELSDGARTLAAVTAAAILRSVDHFPEVPKLWVLCGGGRKNPHIVADMRLGAQSARVLLAEEVGFDGDAMEAEAWGYLAIRSLRQLPLTFPMTTGCREPVVGGVLIET